MTDPAAETDAAGALEPAGVATEVDGTGVVATLVEVAGAVALARAGPSGAAVVRWSQAAMGSNTLAMASPCATLRRREGLNATSPVVGSIRYDRHNPSGGGWTSRWRARFSVTDERSTTAWSQRSQRRRLSSSDSISSQLASHALVGATSSRCMLTRREYTGLAAKLGSLEGATSP